MSFTEMFEKQRAFMLHASTCTSQYDEPHRRLYGEILGLLDEAKQAERERDDWRAAATTHIETIGILSDQKMQLQADLDAALLVCEMLGVQYGRAWLSERAGDAGARVQQLLAEREARNGK